MKVSTALNEVCIAFMKVNLHLIDREPALRQAIEGLTPGQRLSSDTEHSLRELLFAKSYAMGRVGVQTAIEGTDSQAFIRAFFIGGVDALILGLTADSFTQEFKDVSAEMVAKASELGMDLTKDPISEYCVKFPEITDLVSKDVIHALGFPEVPEHIKAMILENSREFGEQVHQDLMDRNKK
eukprot:gnl/Spiro4/13696_TR7295_c1_g1_i1.p2 gnl/Spiro4/13696_TR7295_c1_g1~~gnl/Spiro4/13696_TR7295_c1_g1_i1.p2  ORF type:complete len:182 (+),score=1.79 gnl/Spiro4/13696_TR7295_c1_g1_i1:756-1301(+)